ncbi:hypothetical protein H310_01310 [Aphanomyces invadans]|uniref:Uncharacterized protein n=1 Tax=Aphanomyces invadans TaxID=157072 RepID=A0A024USB3_9STRA|nr:hypothetical protein H310_01310 [Aphanomyces invadans]ETW08797.1 hypothetical protein H310_01310 [Aphanomyces invadans]|eukprot:XP_008862602.1 hypothetical protein H310_01310 [Aphanomyces invadans]
MADAWYNRMVEWSRNKVYRYRGEHCSIAWQMDEVYIPPIPKDHPCRQRIPGCTVIEAAEITTKTTNMTEIHDAVLLDDTNARIADAMVGFFGRVVDYYHLATYGTARRIPQALYFFHNAQVHQLSESINAWTTKQSLFDVDVFQKLGLHSVDSSYDCSRVMVSTVPVLYVDAKGERRCICQCLDGFELTQTSQGAVCEHVPAVPSNECVYSKRAYTYNIDTPHDHDDWNQCRINYLPSFRHMPYPTHNSTDGSLLRVQVVGPNSKAVKFSQRNIKWLPPPFGHQRKNILSDASIRRPGVYTIQVDWSTLDSSVQTTSAVVCKACLAITDRFRPVSNVACPGDAAAIHDLPPTMVGSFAIPTAEYTVRNLLKANEFVLRHYVYGTDVRNDVCGSEGRCDKLKFARRDFYGKVMSSVDAFESGRSCFSDAVSTTTLTRLVESPFGRDLDRIDLADPVPRGLCTRCCQLETTLKEWWRNYQCPSVVSSQAFERQCSGNGESCTSAQCLVAHGPTFFVAQAAIHPTVQVDTVAMMSSVFPTVVYPSSVEVHVLLECSAFGDRSKQQKCSHAVPLRHLLTWSSGLNDVSVLRSATNKSFVFWRYRVLDRGNSTADDYNTASPTRWASADADDAFLRFDAAVSVLEMEAWSQCGRVASFQFHVLLHLTQEVNPAASFDQMWYQTTAAAQGRLVDVLVPFKKSAFAELTFDFSPTMGLGWPPLTENPRRLPHVPMWVSTGVQCSVQLGHVSPSELVHSSSVNVSIVQRMAIAVPVYGESFGYVACNFSYRHVYYANQTHDAIHLVKRFTILPQLDTVTFDQQDVDMYTVCRGLFVHLSDDGSTTVVDTMLKECRAPSVCAPVFALPGTQDISRCVLEWDGETSTASGDASFGMQLLIHTAAPASVALSTMVGMVVVLGGLVALVASRKSRLRTEDNPCLAENIGTDHYYEL